MNFIYHKNLFAVANFNTFTEKKIISLKKTVRNSMKKLSTFILLRVNVIGVAVLCLAVRNIRICDRILDVCQVYCKGLKAMSGTSHVLQI